MSRQKDVRKSQFVEVTQSESTDYLDLVRNGQNFKIKQSNLVNDFGVTGSLVSTGGVSAIPVLESIASIHNIRGLEGGSGITTSVSAQNGIKISQNYEVDKGGVPIMINETALQPTLVSLEAGAGISVGASGKSIQIALSATPPSTKTVVVYEEADFPAAVGDLITLDADTFYLVVADISTANRLKFQANTVLAGTDSAMVTLTYTGVGIFLNGADVDMKLVDINIVAATGTAFDLSSSTGTHRFRMFNCRFEVDTIGNFHNLVILLMSQCNFSSVTTTGMSFTGNFKIALFDTVAINIASGAGSGWILGVATFDYFLIDKALLNTNTTGYSISGAASSANINAGGLGIIVNSRNFGTSAVSDNITSYDDRWEMYTNARIKNSVDLVLATHPGATLNIVTALTPIIVGGSWNIVTSHRFSGTAGGTFTYSGKGNNCSIAATISGAAATATHTYKFYIYVNGVQITASAVSRSFTTSIGNLSMIWETSLDNGDYIEIWVENTTGTADFVLDAMTLRLKGA